MSNSIVKDSTKLREGLKSRWKELKLTQQKVAEDAQEYGQKGITRMAINKYINNPYTKGALNESQIIWLGWRWFIPVTLGVGIPDNKGKHIIPDQYDEKQAKKMLKKFFGNG